MRYPEVLALPVLMLMDYYLTILGSVLQKKKHSEFFVFEEYELNPLWQKSINKKKLVNLKHLIITALVSGWLIYIAEYTDISRAFFSIVLGAILIALSIVVGRHITNILIFWYVLKNPNNIQGQIRYSYEAVLFFALYYNLIPLILLIIIAIYDKSLFVLGGICGVILLFISHIRFLFIMRRRKAKRITKDKGFTRSDY